MRTGIVDVGVQPDPAAQGQISSHREANRVSTHVEYKPEETGRNRRSTENISARVLRNHGTSNSEVGVDRRGAAATVAPLLADASQVIRTTARYCGNFLREDGEECDDGNIEMFDGCSHNCKVEPGWRCRPPRNKIPGKVGGDVMDMEETLVDERQQLMSTLLIPFRAQTVVSPLTPQLWKLFAEKRRTLQLRDP